ncbi:TPA: restriction endonuclease [Photobacterium damselae subsp. damselae]
MFHDRLINKPKDLESYVQYVYSSLLNLRDEGVVVSSNVILVGKSGAKHEVDVYYQFERSGVVHKVAFECKFKSRRVQKSDVIDFHGKLQDIGNIQGIFVSKSGYQQGAKDYAKHYDIQLLTLDDLPTLNILVAKRIESVALPDESYIGEPFWCLMEISNDGLTGSYYSRSNGIVFKKSLIPLFISKVDACEYLEALPDKKDYVVRGLPQHSLKFLFEAANLGKGKINFALMLHGSGPDGLWPGISYQLDELKSRFLLDPA